VKAKTKTNGEPHPVNQVAFRRSLDKVVKLRGKFCGQWLAQLPQGVFFMPVTLRLAAHTWYSIARIAKAMDCTMDEVIAEAIEKEDVIVEMESQVNRENFLHDDEDDGHESTS
jgi:hypothetical protein